MRRRRGGGRRGAARRRSPGAGRAARRGERGSPISTPICSLSFCNVPTARAARRAARSTSASDASRMKPPTPRTPAAPARAPHRRRRGAGRRSRRRRRPSARARRAWADLDRCTRPPAGGWRRCERHGPERRAAAEDADSAAAAAAARAASRWSHGRTHASRVALHSSFWFHGQPRRRSSASSSSGGARLEELAQQKSERQSFQIRSSRPRMKANGCLAPVEGDLPPRRRDRRAPARGRRGGEAARLLERGSVQRLGNATPRRQLTPHPTTSPSASSISVFRSRGAVSPPLYEKMALSGRIATCRARREADLDVLAPRMSVTEVCDQAERPVAAGGDRERQLARPLHALHDLDDARKCDVGPRRGIKRYRPAPTSVMANKQDAASRLVDSDAERRSWSHRAHYRRPRDEPRHDIRERGLGSARGRMRCAPNAPSGAGGTARSGRRRACVSRCGNAREGGPRTASAADASART